MRRITTLGLLATALGPAASAAPCDGPDPDGSCAVLFDVITYDDVKPWMQPAPAGDYTVPTNLDAVLIDHEHDHLANSVVPPALTQRARAHSDPIPFFLGDTALIGDMHTHQFAELTFGQRIVLGGPAAGGGGYHGVRPGLSSVIRTFLPGLSTDAFIQGMLWHAHEDATPHFNSWTHDSYTADHMREAHNNGVRFTVEYLTNQQAACAIADAHQPRDAWTCTDSVNVQRQLRAAWRRHEHALAHSGVLQARVVQSPLEANHIMASGRLAVVLGVEASDYFNTKRRGGIQPDKADAYADFCTLLHRPGSGPQGATGGVATRKAIKRGSASDLSTLDLALSAAAGAQRERLTDMKRGLQSRLRTPDPTLARGMICAMRAQGLSSFIGTHHWNGSVAGAAFQMVTFLQPAYDIVASVGRTSRISLPTFWLLGEFAANRRKLGNWPMVSELAVDPEVEGVQYLRNTYGLSPLGQHVVWEATEQGMVLDLAHLSESAILQSLPVVGSDRPVFLSHYTPRRLTLRNRDNWEYSASERLLLELRARGGVAGLRLAGEPVRSAGGPVSNMCHGSASSFAQMYTHGLRHGTNVGLSTDMNGGTVMSFPRFGEEACSAHSDPGTIQGQRQAQRWLPVGDPRAPMPFGMRSASQGASHFGLVPDFMDDLHQLGQPTGGLSAAADDFVRMWAGSCGAWCDPRLARPTVPGMGFAYRDSVSGELDVRAPFEAYDADAAARPMNPYMWLVGGARIDLRLPYRDPKRGEYALEEDDSDADGLPDTYEKRVRIETRCAPWQIVWDTTAQGDTLWWPHRPPAGADLRGRPWCLARPPHWPADLVGWEVRRLDWKNADTDGDGMDDGMEIRTGANPVWPERRALPGREDVGLIDVCPWLLSHEPPTGISQKAYDRRVRRALDRIPSCAEPR